MAPRNKEIEVEVVAIDDRPPRATPPSPERKSSPPWRDRIRQLPPIWWPFALVLGIIAIALALTVGSVIGICYLISKGIVRLLRSLLSPN